MFKLPAFLPLFFLVSFLLSPQTSLSAQKNEPYFSLCMHSNYHAPLRTTETLLPTNPNAMNATTSKGLAFSMGIVYPVRQKTSIIANYRIGFYQPKIEPSSPLTSTFYYYNYYENIHYHIGTLGLRQSIIAYKGFQLYGQASAQMVSYASKVISFSNGSFYGYGGSEEFYTIELNSNPTRKRFIAPELSVGIRQMLGQRFLLDFGVSGSYSKSTVVDKGTYSIVSFGYAARGEIKSYHQLYSINFGLGFILD